MARKEGSIVPLAMVAFSLAWDQRWSMMPVTCTFTLVERNEKEKDKLNNVRQKKVYVSASRYCIIYVLIIHFWEEKSPSKQNLKKEDLKSLGCLEIVITEIHLKKIIQ